MKQTLLQRQSSSFVLAIFLFLPGFAQAQWQFLAGMGVRHVRMSEFDRNGQTLVREQGWLPGIRLQADYLHGDWRLELGADLYRRDIAYDGRVQSGTAFKTDTGTTLARIDLTLARRIARSTDLVGGLEWDQWQRKIKGHSGVLGLDERYSSWRLLGGAKTSLLQTAGLRIDGKALLVVAGPERMRVGFENGIFDEISFSTKAATGLRMALDFHPTAVPSLSVTADFDWLRIPRSDDAILRRAGAAVGTVAQPEHLRRAFGIRVNYRF